MRQILARLGLRGGAAVGILLLVAGVLTVARLVGGDNRPRPYIGVDAPATATSTVSPGTGDDGVVATPSAAATDEPAVRSRANEFMTAWLRRDATAATWHAGIARLATAALAENLRGVDPRSVPASRVVGGPAVPIRTDAFAQVRFTVDSGAVTLSLLKQDGVWLVDGVDWART